MKKIYIFAGIVVVLAASVFIYNSYFKKVSETVTQTGTNQADLPVLDEKNMQYQIRGEAFNLVDGRVEKELAPGSATKNIAYLFGEPVYGDFDGDEDIDAAVLLVNEPGGSGIFYYAVLNINNEGQYMATQAMLLGDRIAPQNIEVKDGRAIYNFAERRGTEPMTAQPSIGRSVIVHYDQKTGDIGELAKDFEGESR